MSIRVTPGNVDDRNPIPDMMDVLFGKLYADKRYLSKKLAEKLRTMNIDLVTKIKRNMKPVQHADFDAAVLRQRSLIETVFDELKNLSQIEHSPHRSTSNFIVNLLGGVVDYCLMPNKPTLPLQQAHRQSVSPGLIPN